MFCAFLALSSLSHVVLVLFTSKLCLGSVSACSFQCWGGGGGCCLLVLVLFHGQLT